MPLMLKETMRIAAGQDADASSRSITPRRTQIGRDADVDAGMLGLLDRHVVGDVLHHVSAGREEVRQDDDLIGTGVDAPLDAVGMRGAAISRKAQSTCAKLRRGALAEGARRGPGPPGWTTRAGCRGRRGAVLSSGRILR